MITKYLELTFIQGIFNIEKQFSAKKIACVLQPCSVQPANSSSARVEIYRLINMEAREPSW